MLSMQLTQTVRLRLVLGLEIEGGATSSIFPAVEKALHSRSKLAAAVEAVVDGDDPDRYESYIDYLVCQVFPSFGPACFAFYAGGGLQLREQITAAGRDKLEAILLAALWTTEVFYEHQHQCYWNDVRVLLERNLEPIVVRWWPAGVPVSDDAITSLGALLDARGEVFSLPAA